MASIITASIDVAKLPKEKFVKGKNGAVWYNFVIRLQNKTTYTNNVWITDSQTIEEKEAGKESLSLGNGRVVWIENVKNGKGEIQLAEKQEQDAAPNTINDKDDLPF